MLSDDERARIKAEEEFRDLVRHQLAVGRPKQPRDRIWAFLNSNFGLFLLSTVVIGIITWAAGIYEREQKLTSEQREMLQKCDSEVAFRIEPLKHLVENGHVNELVLSELQHVFGSEPPEQHNFMITEARSLFPELKNRNLTSLLYELLSLVEQERRSEIKTALDSAARFEYMIKSSPKKKIHLAEHVIDEIPDFNAQDVAAIEDEIIKAFQVWLTDE